MHLKILLLTIISFSFIFASTYSDTFINDTRNQYTVINSWTKGGVGSFNYDNSGKRLHILTGDNVALTFSHTLAPSTVGHFSLDFLPLTYYPNGGVFTLKLIQNNSTYYQIENTDGYGVKSVNKYINGNLVDSQNFNSEYTQNTQYTLSIDFSPSSTTINAFGQTITINTNISPITVNAFLIETTQQDAFYDNINYITSQTDTNIPPTANAGQDRTTQVNQPITITGSGNDSDGNIVSYEWSQGNTILANTASFDYTPTAVQTDTLTLTVTDNDGAIASDSMKVNVTSDTVTATEVIVDNQDTTAFSTTGTWAESIANDEYAQSSIYSRTLNSSAIWHPNLLTAGLYHVYVWYSGSIYQNRDPQAEYTVHYAGGSQTVTVNQN
ncbi:MAG TPA: hypothetical protein ENK99_02765, partial [Campylobacterales bacterium]|nr:hypothetical protein [Campylobacterales bacterium]